MKRIVMFLIIASIIIYCPGCSVIKKPDGNKSVPLKSSQKKNYNISSEKVYNIPKELQKQSYTVDEFKQFYSEYLKLNNFKLETSPENDKTGMTKEEQLKYYTIYDITPKELREEIECQIFKINYTCETYIIYKSKVFHIGFGFGGFGVISLATCDIDRDGQKDLIYTFSWGAGLHRSQIGIFNLSTEKEKWLGFVQENEDIMLEKVSDRNFKVYIASLSSKSENDLVHFNIIKQEHIADVQIKDVNIEVIKCNN